MADRNQRPSIEPLPDELRDYASYNGERHRLGHRLAGRLRRAPLSKDSTTYRRPRMRLLYVTFPLAALALVAVAVATSLNPRDNTAEVTTISPKQPHITQSAKARVTSESSLTVSASLDQSVLLAGSGEDRFLVVEFEAPEAGPRGPVHISAVVDTSGSMSGDKIDFARKALRTLAEQLGPEDTLSIVGFDDEATVYLPTEPADSPRIFDAIASLQPNGGTTIGAGLAEGLAQLSRVERAGARRVVLLSDGLSVEGAQSLSALARSRVESGITVSTLGLGLDFDSTSLIAMSDAGGGRYRYVDRPEGLPALFGEELDTLTRVASQGVALDVRLADGVEVKSVYGYEENDGEISAEGYRAFIGDMHGGQQRKVVARLHVPDGIAGVRAVASVTVSYTTPIEGSREHLTLPVGASIVTDNTAAAASIEPRILLLAAQAIEGNTLEGCRAGWLAGDAGETARAYREGDEVLSRLEGYLGRDVSMLRSRLKSNAAALGEVAVGTPEGRAVRLRTEVLSAEAME